MNQWRYTSEKQDVVFRELPNGGMESMLVTEVIDKEAILPFIPPPVPVPSRVSMRQARLALLEAGLYDSIGPAIAAITHEPTRRAAEIEWEYATDVERNSGLVPVLGSALGLSETDLDNLFTRAATL